jgi:hypothetical protein
MAAIHTPVTSEAWARIPCGSYNKKAEMISNVFFKLPLFSKYPDAERKLKLTLVESFSFLQYLRSIKDEVFSQKIGTDEEGKSFEYIPYTWIALTLRVVSRERLNNSTFTHHSEA